MKGSISAHCMSKTGGTENGHLLQACLNPLQGVLTRLHRVRRRKALPLSSRQLSKLKGGRSLLRGTQRHLDRRFEGGFPFDSAGWDFYWIVGPWSIFYCWWREIDEFGVGHNLCEFYNLLCEMRGLMSVRHHWGNSRDGWKGWEILRRGVCT